MAQRRRRSAARSLGLEVRPRSLVALCAVCLVVGMAALWARPRASGLVVERAAGEEPAQLAEPADGASEAEPAPAEGDAAAQEAPERIVVHVDGAVAAPGLIELEGEGLRIADAIDAAGGLTEDAETASLNLAARLEDGQKVHVQREGEEQVAVAAPDASASAGRSAAGLINLNTADAALLQELPGIGERTAEAIIRDREENGLFTCAEDLMRVNGIGEKKFARLESLVTV